MEISSSYIITFILIFIFGHIEGLLTVFFNHWYYNNGIICYKREKTFLPNLNNPITEEFILSLVPDTVFVPFKIKSIAENKFAIREAFISFFKIVNVSVMRGVITIDDSRSKVSIEGLLNISPLMFTVFLLILSITLDYFIFVFFFIFLIITVLSYFLQTKRFKDIIFQLSN